MLLELRRKDPTNSLQPSFIRMMLLKGRHKKKGKSQACLSNTEYYQPDMIFISDWEAASMNEELSSEADRILLLQNLQERVSHMLTIFPL